MHPIIRKHSIDVVKLMLPRYHYREIPVMKRQSLRYREAILPRFAARYDGRGADEILFQEGNRLVAFVIRAFVDTIGGLGVNASVLIHYRGVAVDQAYLGEFAEQRKHAIQIVTMVPVITIDSGDVSAARVRKRFVYCCYVSLVIGMANHAQARISKGAQDLLRVVCRGVVHQDDFKVMGPILTEDAFHTLREEGREVVGEHDEADGGLRHQLSPRRTSL